VRRRNPVTGSRHGEETEKTQPADHGAQSNRRPGGGSPARRRRSLVAGGISGHGRRAASAARSSHTRRARELGRFGLPLAALTCESLRAMRLLLASTSPARRVLLDGLGVSYVAEAPGVNEDVPPGTSVEDAVRMLALRKARAVASRHPDALVLGADQL